MNQKTLKAKSKDLICLLAKQKANKTFDPKIYV